MATNKENCSNEFDVKQFENPSVENRSVPFWSWNCKLDKEMMRRQIGYFKEMGFGGFMMHSRTGLQTKYLGEEFMDAVKFCTEEAERQGLQAWLYDEDRWPSGYAGGLVLKEDISLCIRYLQFTPNNQDTTLTEEEALACGAPYFVAAFDVELDENDKLASYRRIARDEEANGQKWYAFASVKGTSGWYNGSTYVDVLNPKAIKKFLEITHDKYYDLVGEKFGSTVPAIFFDEPSLPTTKMLRKANGKFEANLPWSSTLPAVFEERYGYDVLNCLPEMFWQQPNDKPSQVRHDLWDCIAERFAVAFSDQISAWCREHNIKCTGHYLFEENLPKQVIYSGELMRQYRSMDIPGVDRLGFKEWDDFNTMYMQVRSIIRQYGRKQILSEMYGISNWEYDFRKYKAVGDWQAVMGITDHVPHLAYLSMEGECKRDFPASIHYQSPWYKKFPIVEDHYARLKTVLTRGTSLTNIAIIHPIESMWMIFGPNDQTEAKREEIHESFRFLCKELVLGHIDSDMISESLLLDLYNKEEKADGIKIGKAAYNTVIVPYGCTILRKTTIDALNDLIENGGRIIFMCDCPTCFEEDGAKLLKEIYGKSTVIANDTEALKELLADERKVNIYNENGEEDRGHICQLRTDGGKKWLFVVNAAWNEDQHPDGENVKIAIDGCYVPKVYDTLSGAIKEIPFCNKNGKTVIDTKLYVHDSLLLCFEPQAEPKCVKAGSDEETVLWSKKMDQKVKYSLDEPNVLLLDSAEYAIDDNEYSPALSPLKITLKEKEKLGIRDDGSQPWSRKDIPTEHTLSLRFTVHSDIDCADVCLGIEKPELASLVWNGEKVESICEGWYIDEAIKVVRLPGLKKGDNELLITMPFGLKSWAENCYLLGDFGVKVDGAAAVVTERDDEVTFESVVNQGLPFYSANITYDVPFNAEEDGTLRIKADKYVGALMQIALDDKVVGDIAFQPYTLDIPHVTAGEHTVKITLYGTRYNTLACLHLVNDSEWNAEPRCFRTEGDGWTDDYRFHPFGLLEAPEFTFIKK